VQDVSTVDLDLEMAMTDQDVNEYQELKISKTWRALRMAAHSKLSMFDNLADGKSLDCLIDKGTAQIADADDTQDVEGADEEGSRPVHNNEPGSVNERSGDDAAQEANLQ
jgi:THO complex subunit 1 transcription elongation factor